jgi:histone-lysine N-methyltransferase SETMAR
MNQVLLLSENARPHTNLHTRQAVAKVGRTVLPHSPYSPDLAPSDFVPFGLLKDALWGRRFADDNELIHRVREQLRRFSKEFYATVIERLTQRWKSVLIMETLWKNDLNFVKDVHMIYVNFIVIVILIYEK